MLPFGQTLLLWRFQRGLTQQDLAAKARIPRTALSAMERGRREVTLKTLRTLAAALGIRPGLLADGIGPVPEAGSTTLSRQALERVADGVAGGSPVRSRQERVLVNLLREILRHRLSPAGSRGILRRGKKAMDAAWLSLNASQPPEAVRSLLERIEGRLRLR